MCDVVGLTKAELEFTDTIPTLVVARTKELLDTIALLIDVTVVTTEDLWPVEGVGRGTTVDRWEEVAAVGAIVKEALTVCVNELMANCLFVVLSKFVDFVCI